VGVASIFISLYQKMKSTEEMNREKFEMFSSEYTDEAMDILNEQNYLDDEDDQQCDEQQH